MASPYTAEYKLVYVNCPINPLITQQGSGTFKYCFRTPLDNTSGVQLGHKSALTGNKIVAGGVIGANAPKPKTATKQFGGSRRSESSFVGADAELTAAANGWLISNAKQKNYNRTARLVPVYVTALSNGEPIKYGWTINLDQWSLLSQHKSVLGIEEIPSDRIPINIAIFGVNAPRPARVKRAVIGGQLAPKPPDNPSNASPAPQNIDGYFSTFVAHDKVDNAIQGGWSVQAAPAVLQGIQMF